MLTKSKEELPLLIEGEPILQEATPWYKKWGKATLAIVGSLQYAINAFLYPSHIQPSEISKKWFFELSAITKFKSFLNGISSLSVNSLLNYKTIPAAFNMLKTRLFSFRQAPFKTIGLILFSAASGVSAATIGYENFLSVGFLVSVSAGVFSFSIVSGTRFFGLANLIERYQMRHHPQRRIIKLLKLATKTNRNKISQALNQKQLNRETIISVLQFTEQLILNDASFKNYKGYECVARVFDYTLALISALSVSPLFAQKFLDGSYFIIPAWREKHTTNAIILKNLSSLSLSCATPALYFSQALEFRKTLERIVECLSDENIARSTRMKFFLIYVSLLSMNVFAATSNLNLMENIQKDKNNIFQWMLNSSTVSIFSYLAASSAFILNAKLSIDQVNDSAPVARLNYDNPTVEDLIKWLEKNQLTNQEIQEVDQFRFDLRK